MSTQIAQLEIPPHAAPHGKTERAIVEDMLPPERPLGAARGIVSAVLIAAPFWALFAFAVYLLI